MLDKYFKKTISRNMTSCLTLSIIKNFSNKLLTPNFYLKYCAIQEAAGGDRDGEHM